MSNFGLRGKKFDQMPLTESRMNNNLTPLTQMISLAEYVAWSLEQFIQSPPSSETSELAASQCAQVVYLREILRECHFEQPEPTMVYEDNRACLLMSENPVSRERSRHVDPI